MPTLSPESSDSRHPSRKTSRDLMETPITRNTLS